MDNSEDLAEIGYDSGFCTRKGLMPLADGLKARTDSSLLRSELDIQGNDKYKQVKLLTSNICRPITFF